jgi:hypothetical protein
VIVLEKSMPVTSGEVSVNIFSDSLVHCNKETERKIITLPIIDRKKIVDVAKLKLFRLFGQIVMFIKKRIFAMCRGIKYLHTQSASMKKRLSDVF